MDDIKVFFNYYKPYKVMFFTNIVLAFILSLLDLIFPATVKYSIDTLIPTNNLSDFYKLCLFIVVVSILRFFIGFLVQFRGRLLGMNIETDMRRDLFIHIQHQGFEFFDHNKTGILMSRLVNDLTGVSSFIHRGPEDFFLAFVSIIGSVTLMSLMNKKLTLIVLIALPILIGFAFINKKIMSKYYKESRKKIGDINAQAENSIGGIRVVKAFTNEDFERSKFDEKNNEYRSIKRTVFIVSARYFSGLNLIMNALNLVVLFFGGKMVFTSDISLGVLVGFLLYINKFFMPIRKIMNLMETYQRGMAGFHRFKEVMDIPPCIIANSNKPLEIHKGEISIKNIYFKYKSGHKNILNNFSLNIKGGENIALVGGSGAGKTTISSIIPRFYDVDSGDIEVDKQNIKDVSLESLRKKIGIIQQDVFLFDGSILENILYGRLDATLKEVIEASKNANIYEFIMTQPKGFDTEVGERGVKLSGGQKQRIAIARVFLKNPPILILDEATSSLDNSTEKLIQESLDRLSKNRTTITIAHRLSTIKNRDRIIVLKDGRVVEEGTHINLLKNKKLYYRLYKSNELVS